VKHRSLILAILVLLAVLVVGVPLFLRTPVWVDVTYHDLSAWNILHGGTHYKDVFETNLPGMVWAHALVRPVVGWSHEAIRIVDLLVVSSVVFLLSGFLRRSGLSINQRIWFVTAVALFYLAETEFIHCQRDGWMLLPAMGAATMRLTRLSSTRSLKWTVCEGLLWGLAVWIKPHALVPALLVWLVSMKFQTRRIAIVDSCWLIAGGLVAGGLGSFWLVTTGTWKPMWDVLLNWNQEYYSWTWEDTFYKCRLLFTYFAPFSLLYWVSLPLAVSALFRRDPARAILAALYLGWLAQATLIQKPFDYAHYPPMLLGLAVIASFRLPVGQVLLAWCLVAGITNEIAKDHRWFRNINEDYRITTALVLPHYPMVDRNRLALWGRCWHDDSWELKDQLSFYDTVHCAPNWADLNRVGEFLKTKKLQDRELICWHDSTHPLYVELGIKPGIRYPHVITAMKFRSKREQIKSETFTSPARYVVSDLVPIMYSARFGPFPPPGPATELPPEFPDWRTDIYPWNQPVVYRSGRYIVHEVKEPKGEIVFPLPKELWE